MKILIIEDEVLAYERLERILKDIDPKITVLANTTDIKSSVKWLNENEHPDIVFMDIELTDGQSFEIFDIVKIRSHIIFVTSYDEFVLKAFDYQCISYLLKPINPLELQRSLLKFEELNSQLLLKVLNIDALKKELNLLQPPKPRLRFLVKNGSKYIPVEVKEIAYFFTESTLTFLMTWVGKKYILNCSLEEIIGSVDDTIFFHANRSCIINLNSIESVQNDLNGKLIVGLKPNKELYISKEKATEFKKWLDS